MGKPAFVLTFCAILLFMPSCAPPPPVEHEAQYDAIIVGAGLAGLATATHLSLSGLKVLVLEQHDKVGGCATRFEREDFTFDSALHAMSGGGPGKNERGLRKLLKMTGVDKKVELIELPELYRSIFPGLDITMPNNWSDLKQVVKEKWPDESDGIELFHDLCRKTAQDIISMKNLFRYRGPRLLWHKALVPLKHRTFYKYKYKTFQDVLDDCFHDDDLKAVIGQLWTFYGPPPRRQTAIIGLAATETYLSDGSWHIKGTSQALSIGYAERIRELGGEIKTETLVTKIIVENGVAQGIETAGGETYTGRYIVANTDPFQLVNELVGRDNFPKAYIDRIEELKPANSLFGVYMGLNIDLRDRGYHNTEIFYNTNKDPRAMYNSMMSGNLKDGVVAITIYSNFGDPIYAPPGKSVLTLTAYSSIDTWPEDTTEYYKLKGLKEDELIALAANVIPELADNNYVEIKEGYTPRTIQRFTKNKGGIVYGFDMTPEQWTRIPHETPIQNIYITSSWSQAWQGMGPAQANGWRAARLILDRERL